MTQLRASSAEVIYDTLVADETFMSYVGTRKFASGGEELDSISILTPGESLPTIASQEGLEVVIHDSGNISRKDYLTNPSDTLVTWQIFLIVWPPATGADMTEAARRVMELFGGSSAIPTVPTPEGLNSLVQTLINIPESSIILA